MAHRYKFPHIDRIGKVRGLLDYASDSIIVEEKLDGANGVFWVEDSEDFLEGSKIQFASRNLLIPNNFADGTPFNEHRRYILQQMADTGSYPNPNYIYYVEYMQKHTIQYRGDIPKAIGIDIRVKEHPFDKDKMGGFLPRKAKEEEFARIGLTTAPLIWEGQAGSLYGKDYFELIPDSAYYNGKAEGIVIKNETRISELGGHQLRAKVVSEIFKEVNKATFGGYRVDNDDTIKFCEEFVTRRRIIKKVLDYNALNSSDTDMRYMTWLPKLIMQDVLTEEWEALLKLKIFTTDTFKKRTMKMCARVLNEIVTLGDKAYANDTFINGEEKGDCPEKDRK